MLKTIPEYKIYLIFHIQFKQSECGPRVLKDWEPMKISTILSGVIICGYCNC